MVMRPGYHRSVAEFKRELLTHALIAHGGNKTHAARSLRLQRTYFSRLCHQHGVTMKSGIRLTMRTDGLVPLYRVSNTE
jgi:DNA-binding NtrC family response regulator